MGLLQFYKDYLSDYNSVWINAVDGEIVLDDDVMTKINDLINKYKSLIQVTCGNSIPIIQLKSKPDKQKLECMQCIFYITAARNSVVIGLKNSGLTMEEINSIANGK